MKCSTGERCSDENCTCGWGTGEHSGLIDDKEWDGCCSPSVGTSVDSGPSITASASEQKQSMHMTFGPHGKRTVEFRMAEEEPVCREFKIIGDDPEIQVIGFLTQAMEYLDEIYSEQVTMTTTGGTTYPTPMRYQSGKEVPIKDRIAKWFFHKYSIGIPVDK